MTPEEAQAQIDLIRRVSEEIRKTPESAHRFLVEAGIIEDKPFKKPRRKIKK